MATLKLMAARGGLAFITPDEAQVIVRELEAAKELRAAVFRPPVCDATWIACIRANYALCHKSPAAAGRDWQDRDWLLCGAVTALGHAVEEIERLRACLGDARHD